MPMRNDADADDDSYVDADVDEAKDGTDDDGSGMDAEDGGTRTKDASPKVRETGTAKPHGPRPSPRCEILLGEPSPMAVLNAGLFPGENLPSGGLDGSDLKVWLPNGCPSDVVMSMLANTQELPNEVR